MNNAAKVALYGGGIVGTVLIGQWAYNNFFTVGSNNSVLSQAGQFVANNAGRIIDSNAVPGVKTNYPIIVNGELRDCPVGNPGNNMDGIWNIVKIIFDNENSADVICAHISSESQTGNLTTNCYNCSLANIHWTQGVSVNDPSDGSPHSFPPVYIGTDKCISFLTGANSESQGFVWSVAHLKDYLQRRAPDAIIAARDRNWNNWIIALARAGYNTSYQNAVSNGTVRDNWVRARWNRIVSAGLVTGRQMG